jgi:hypothetical protein
MPPIVTIYLSEVWDRLLDSPIHILLGLARQPRSHRGVLLLKVLQVRRDRIHRGTTTYVEHLMAIGVEIGLVQVPLRHQRPRPRIGAVWPPTAGNDKPNPWFFGPPFARCEPGALA